MFIMACYFKIAASITSCLNVTFFHLKEGEAKFREKEAVETNSNYKSKNINPAKALMKLKNWKIKL